MRIVSKLFLVAGTCCTMVNVPAQRFIPSVREFITDSAATTALIDVKIIDGTGSSSKTHQTIVIDNGLIGQIGKVQDVTIPKGAKIINCSGKTVLPGFVMLHEHLFYTLFLGEFFNVAEMPFSFPRMYLAGGATTIRTGGSIEPQTDLAINQMIKEGKLIGPDMDVTAPYIERKGYDVPALNIIKDSAEAAATVKFWADKGCTSFKMYVHATKQDLIAVVREAHKRRLKVTGHLGTLTYGEAATLGIDNIEHGFLASSDFDPDKKEDETDYDRENLARQHLDVNSTKMKDLMDLLIQKNVAITSTLPVFEPFTDREIILGGGSDAVAPQVKKDVTDWWQGSQRKDSSRLALFRKEMAWEKQFYNAGGLLVCGTDPTGSGRTVAGYGSRREIELLVEAGFTPTQAVKIATLNGAKYLGREKTIGSVEQGKNADLVLVDGDPEKNIADIRKTEIVFKNGVGYDSKKIFESVKGRVGLN